MCNQSLPSSTEVALREDEAAATMTRTTKCQCIPLLSRFQWTQLGLLTTCFTLAFSSVTLVMSEAPLIVRGAGGGVSLAPVSIAVFEIGKSFVVLPVGPMVIRYGRKKVFLVGGLFGMLSSVMGIMGVIYSIPYLILLSTFFAGFSTGISYGYRFAAIECAKLNREFAVTMCLSGGIIAAIVGPTSAEGSKDWFSLTYIGTYVMNMAFVGANVILVAFLKFPSGTDKTRGTAKTPKKASVISACSTISTTSTTNASKTSSKRVTEDIEATTKSKNAAPSHSDVMCEASDSADCVVMASTDAEIEGAKGGTFEDTLKTRDLLLNKVFIYACLISTMTWVCMSVPLSVVGLAMNDVEPPVPNQLQRVAFVAHFLGMFLPGLVTGRLIKELGFCWVGVIAVFTFSLGTIVNLFAAGGDATLWIIGQFLVGAAWNFGFSAATVMLSTSCPPEKLKHAAKVQSYNDFISFFGGGIITISAGYIYDSNNMGGGLAGWKLLNYIEFLFIGIMMIILIAAWRHGGRSLTNSGNMVEQQ